MRTLNSLLTLSVNLKMVWRESLLIKNSKWSNESPFQKRSYYWKKPIKDYVGGFPWWSSGKESACQWRGYRFNPLSGKVSHASRQWSPCATTTECSATREVTATISLQLGSVPWWPKLEKACAQQPRPSVVKNKTNIFFKRINVLTMWRTTKS